jgi:hypothetical protein
VPTYGPEIAKTIKSTVGMPKIASDFFDRLDALATAMNPPRRVLKPGDELLLSRYCYILALFEQEVRSVSQGRRTVTTARVVGLEYAGSLLSLPR